MTIFEKGEGFRLFSCDDGAVGGSVVQGRTAESISSLGDVLPPSAIISSFVTVVIGLGAVRALCRGRVRGDTVGQKRSTRSG